MQGSPGLYTQTAPVSQGAPKSGLVEFSACMNVDISDRFRVSRRRPITRMVALSAHSLYPVGERYCLFVSGTDLNLLLPTLTEFVTIATVTGLPLACVVVDGIAYWTDNVLTGKVIDGINHPWIAPINPEGYKTRAVFDPPAGQAIGFYNGRWYIAQGPVVWYSDPFAPDIWTMADGFLSFESSVPMVQGVAGGLFVSDSAQTWFLSGGDPTGFSWKVIDGAPALKGSNQGAVGAVQADGNGGFTYVPGGKQECAFWLTEQGVMVGNGDGLTINITDIKMDLVGPYTQGAVLVDGAALVAQFI